MAAPPAPGSKDPKAVDDGPIPFFTAADTGGDWLGSAQAQPAAQPPLAHQALPAATPAGPRAPSQAAHGHGPPPPVAALAYNATYSSAPADPSQYYSYTHPEQTYSTWPNPDPVSGNPQAMTLGGQGYDEWQHQPTTQQTAYPEAQGYYAGQEHPGVASTDGQQSAGYYDNYGYYAEDGTYVAYDSQDYPYYDPNQTYAQGYGTTYEQPSENTTAAAGHGPTYQYQDYADPSYPAAQGYSGHDYQFAEPYGGYQDHSYSTYVPSAGAVSKTGTPAPEIQQLQSTYDTQSEYPTQAPPLQSAPASHAPPKNAASFFDSLVTSNAPTSGPGPTASAVEPAVASVHTLAVSSTSTPRATTQTAMDFFNSFSPPPVSEPTTAQLDPALKSIATPTVLETPAVPTTAPVTTTSQPVTQSPVVSSALPSTAAIAEPQPIEASDALESTNASSPYPQLVTAPTLAPTTQPAADFFDSFVPTPASEPTAVQLGLVPEATAVASVSGPSASVPVPSDSGALPHSTPVSSAVAITTEVTATSLAQPTEPWSAVESTASPTDHQLPTPTDDAFTVVDQSTEAPHPTHRASASHPYQPAPISADISDSLNELDDLVHQPSLAQYPEVAASHVPHVTAMPSTLEHEPGVVPISNVSATSPMVAAVPSTPSPVPPPSQPSPMPTASPIATQSEPDISAEYDAYTPIHRSHTDEPLAGTASMSPPRPAQESSVVDTSLFASVTATFSEQEYPTAQPDAPWIAEGHGQFFDHLTSAVAESPQEPVEIAASGAPLVSAASVAPELTETQPHKAASSAPGVGYPDIGLHSAPSDIEPATAWTAPAPTNYAYAAPDGQWSNTTTLYPGAYTEAYPPTQSVAAVTAPEASPYDYTSPQPAMESSYHPDYAYDAETQAYADYQAYEPTSIAPQPEGTVPPSGDYSSDVAAYSYDQEHASYSYAPLSDAAPGAETFDYQTYDYAQATATPAPVASSQTWDYAHHLPEPAVELQYDTTTHHQVPDQAAVAYPSTTTAPLASISHPSYDQRLQEDFYRRGQGCPLIAFGFGGQVWCMFPQASAPRYGADGNLATEYAKSYPGSLQRYTLTDGRGASTLTREVPGPLLTTDCQANTQKQPTVQQMVREFIAGLESDTSSNNDLILLSKVLLCLAEQEGAAVADATTTAALHHMLKSTLPFQQTDPHHVSADGQPPLTAVDGQFVELEQLLLDGNRLDAVKLALKYRWWSHALIIGSCIDKSVWQEVVQAVTQDLSQSASESTTDAPRSAEDPAFMCALKVLYGVFSGSGPAALRSLWHPKPLGLLAEHSDDTHNGHFIPAADFTPSEYSTASSSDGQTDRAAIRQRVLSHWLRIVVMLLANPVPGEAPILTLLGDELRRHHRLAAAHTCYLLSPSTSLFTGYGAPNGRLTLLHSRCPVLWDPVAFRLTEVYEFVQSLKATSKSPVIVAHLQPYKLLYAWWLTEQGRLKEATWYCDAVAALIEDMPKESPFLTAGFIHQLTVLKQRLDGAGATSEASGSQGAVGSWLSRKLAKPSFSSLMSAFDTSLDKLITGANASAAASGTATSASGRQHSAEILPEATPAQAYPGGQAMAPPPLTNSVSMTGRIGHPGDTSAWPADTSPGLQTRHFDDAPSPQQAWSAEYPTPRATSAQGNYGNLGYSAGSPRPRNSSAMPFVHSTTGVVNPARFAPVASSPLTQPVDAATAYSQPSVSAPLRENSTQGDTAPVFYNLATSIASTSAAKADPLATHAAAPWQISVSPTASSAQAVAPVPTFYTVDDGAVGGGGGAQMTDDGLLNPVGIVPSFASQTTDFHYGANAHNQDEPGGSMEDDLGFGNSSLSKARPSTASTSNAGPSSQPPPNSSVSEPAKAGGSQGSSAPKSQPSQASATDGSSPGGGGLFGFGMIKNLFGSSAKSTDGGKPAVKANLGEEVSFYYDPEQKRWVNKNAKAEDQTATTPPPPPPMGGRRSFTAMASTPTATPPSSFSATGPPVASSPTGSTAPTLANSYSQPGYASMPASAAPSPSPTPPRSLPPANGQPRPPSSLDPYSASAAAARRNRRGARSRYVDVLNSSS